MQPTIWTSASLVSSDRERYSGEQDTMSVWLSNLLVVSSSLVLSTFPLSMSRPSFSKDLVFSDEVRSHSPTKNLPPFIWLCCPNRLSRGSLWNLGVDTKSYPSPKKSSISAARQTRVLTSAELVCAVNVNFSQLEILFVCYAWTHSAIACSNDFFWSALTAAFTR